eukprot:TRINITY_DN988_c0_g2_i2.p1 TRINITY_DN988_c0_g2~~TRINITY_DN988_c0_g2_i2.p1  ORF type:complete len:333 (+),score=61.55 TRINITY_DN988_c0_g2_i2:503-1501(+)
MLDEGFVGLIFSCFNQDSSKAGRIQAIAFQSHDPSYAQPPPRNNQWQSRTEGSEMQGSDTPLQSAPPSYAATLRQSSSNSLQEAMQLSVMDQSGGVRRREVPMRVVNAPPVLFEPSACLTSLQRVLFAEEKGAYQQALLERQGRIHPLAEVHHAAAYQASLCKLIEYCLAPVITSLQDRLHKNKATLLCREREVKQRQQATQTPGVDRRADAGQAASSNTERESEATASGSLGGRRGSSGGAEAPSSAPQLKLPLASRPITERQPQADPFTMMHTPSTPIPGWPTTGTQWPTNSPAASPCAAVADTASAGVLYTVKVEGASPLDDDSLDGGS